MTADAETTPVTRLTVALNRHSDDALRARMDAEGLNATTIVNRALQVYDALARRGALTWEQIK
jgi:hypothetical protein